MGTSSCMTSTTSTSGGPIGAAWLFRHPPDSKKAKTPNRRGSNLPHSMFCFDWRSDGLIASLGASLFTSMIRSSVERCFLRDSVLCNQHYAEPRLAAQHAIVGGSSLFEREGLDHGPNPSEGTKVERLFRFSGGP